MGSGSSRMSPARSPHHHRPDARPRPALAAFLCGGASSSSAPQENELSGIPMIPIRDDPELAHNLHSSMKDSPLDFSSENSSSNSTDEHLRHNLSNNGGLKDGATELRNVETHDIGKCFSESRELVPCLVNASSGLEPSHPEAFSDLASTSTKPEHVEPFVANLDSSSHPVVPMTNVSTNHYDSLTSPMRFSSGTFQLESSNFTANDISFTGNSPSEGFESFDIHNSETNSSSAVSTTSTSWLLLGEPAHESSSSGSSFLSSSGSGEGTNGTVLHVDVVSISSNVLPSSTGEISNHEARRNSRRSLLDISDDLFGDDSIYLRRRRRGLYGRNLHTRSEIREQFRSAFDIDARQTPYCPSGMHPDGTCSCESLTSEDSSTRASISRIVMLAEALFEVLDEIHRQPVSLSFSMVSPPAPESVVNSLPLKHHKKLDSVGSADDVEQCYICLAEYEEGDGIRVLPCCHEYHSSCVDKWLKEIHGVCPLCRRDVAVEASAC